MFIYSYQQHDHLLPGNDRMLVIGSSALAKNHGHLKSSRLAADTLIFNFPLNHPRLWRQMEHSLSGARYSIILFMWPPLHLSPANGRLMEKPPEGGGPMESAEDMLCRLFAFLRKQTRRLILLSSPPSDYGSARHPYAEEPGVLEAWNALLRTLAGKLNLPFIDFCGDMLQYRPLPDSGEEDFPEAYRNLGKQVLHRLPFGQTWVRRRSGKIHRLLEKRRNSRTAPAPSLRPAGTAKGTGMPEKPPRTMKRTNERKPPNYFPCGEKRLPPAKIPAPAFKDFRRPLLQITDIPFPA